MLTFFYELRKVGIPVTVHNIMDFYKALSKGLVTDIDKLFLILRLIIVKRVEHYDAFERVFQNYFFEGRSGLSARDWAELLLQKPFEKWLEKMVEDGKLSPEEVHNMSLEELINKFWETVSKQDGPHHGGNQWVGTGGRSPFGHSGYSSGGVRVYGKSLHGTARKVIGERRFINYSEDAPLTKENIKQILACMKSLQPIGPPTELDVDETIYKTAKNGGEIELVFRRELRNKLSIVVLLDNGGYSMTPYIPLVKILFRRIRDTFEDVKYFYFHNCIYGVVYKDVYRSEPLEWKELLQMGPQSRLIIIGDANMAPSALMASFGSIDMTLSVRKPGYQWLQELRRAFPASVWLNPIPRSRWKHESITIYRIASIFHMEDLTLGGLKNAVAYLNAQNAEAV